jgi:hypothetical protein
MRRAMRGQCLALGAGREVQQDEKNAQRDVSHQRDTVDKPLRESN